MMVKVDHGVLRDMARRPTRVDVGFKAAPGLFLCHTSFRIRYARFWHYADAQVQPINVR